MKIGFPTGKLDGTDISGTVARNASVCADALEYSALRFHELHGIIGQVLKEPVVDGRRYSFHAPANYSAAEETEIVPVLKMLPRDWPIILHPDSIKDWTLWEEFGEQLLLENMDLRKHFGTSVADMWEALHRLPEAKMCFDIGHARQVDRSLRLALSMYYEFHTVIREIHMSQVLPTGAHTSLNKEVMEDFVRVLSYDLLPLCPIILETVLQPEKMADDLLLVLDNLGKEEIK